MFKIEIRTRETKAKRNYGAAITELRANGHKLSSCPYSPEAGETLLKKWAGLQFNGAFRALQGRTKDRLKALGYNTEVLEYKKKKLVLWISKI